MNEDIEDRLWRLRLDIEGKLDQLHKDLLAKLKSMARSTGQRTRSDRL